MICLMSNEELAEAIDTTLRHLHYTSENRAVYERVEKHFDALLAAQEKRASMFRVEQEIADEMR